VPTYSSPRARTTTARPSSDAYTLHDAFVIVLE
jgi:hypothetical protein